jgi:hypothetical protein
MRRIEKDLTLATAYKNWLDNLEQLGENHPEYTSNNQYYKDVVANLLWIQQGLCAYTEMYLIDKDKVAPINWTLGRVNDFEFLGHLDHYYSSLKKERGWDWNNFFVIHADVNVKKKGKKIAHGILKPDDPHYNPFYFLEYDFKSHNFLPNCERDESLQEKILNDINTLGLNFQPIADFRREYLNPLIDDVFLRKLTLDEARGRLVQFYTAFEMSIQSLKLE